MRRKPFPGKSLGIGFRAGAAAFIPHLLRAYPPAGTFLPFDGKGLTSPGVSGGGLGQPRGGWGGIAKACVATFAGTRTSGGMAKARVAMFAGTLHAHASEGMPPNGPEGRTKTSTKTSAVGGPDAADLPRAAALVVGFAFGCDRFLGRRSNRPSRRSPSQYE